MNNLLMNLVRNVNIHKLDLYDSFKLLVYLDKNKKIYKPTFTVF